MTTATTIRTPVAIVGASGYSGEELLRILLSHPHATLTAVTSRQYAGQSIARIFPRFAHHPKSHSLRFTEPNAGLLAKSARVIFLALPHGVASEFAVPLAEQGCIVIDLSADFRLRNPEVYQEFYGHPHPAPQLLKSAVYGLPEAYRDRIRAASLIASPGCYPTSILLPLLPLVRNQLIRTTGIIANSLSGVSGAGRKIESDYLFVECNESLRAYAIPKHRHLAEIEQELSLAADSTVTIQFTPHLVPVNRGILTTLYLAPNADLHSESDFKDFNQRISGAYEKAYSAEPFVRVLADPELPDTKNVTGTNMLELAWRLDPRTGRLIVISAEDNLIKGAAGQAVQSFNILSGFPETAGLA